MEFHPNFFLLKDRATKKILHQGRCEGGLFPLVSHGASMSKQALGVNKPSISRWHSLLGHPTFPIVKRVLENNGLLSLSDNSSKSVCDLCQRVKSHKLPYGRSNTTSSIPLELIFSDGWGPAPTSVGKHSYYVSIIDDFSKFTWIYLLKHKFDIFLGLPELSEPRGKKG